MAEVSLVSDFVSTGLTVAGLPEGWRKVRRDADIVTASDLWVDVNQAAHQVDLEPSQRFVSNAMATAWLISEMPVAADHLLQFAEAMTAEIAGWTLRSRKAGSGDLYGSTLFGVLQSPLGDLVSNSQFVVTSEKPGQYVLAQLAVTAVAGTGHQLDDIRLVAVDGRRTD